MRPGREPYAFGPHAQRRSRGTTWLVPHQLDTVWYRRFSGAEVEPRAGRLATDPKALIQMGDCSASGNRMELRTEITGAQKPRTMMRQVVTESALMRSASGQKSQQFGGGRDRHFRAYRNGPHSDSLGRDEAKSSRRALKKTTPYRSRGYFFIDKAS